jgi:integrase
MLVYGRFCPYIGHALDIAKGPVLARRVRDRALDSREARGKLKARGKPYWRVIERGVHIGYRRLRGKAGTWWARHYLGEQQYDVEPVGIADDLSDADGAKILDYWQAVEVARKRMVERAHGAAGKIGPLTVAAAMDAYLEFLDNNRRSGYDARRRDLAFIRPKLGDVAVADLTATTIRKWHADLAKQPPRLRTKAGDEQKYRKIGKDGESLRRRRASSNRTLTILKAALNMAWREHPKKVPSNAEWHRVEPFENVDAARVRYLTVAEAKRLLNACAPDFRRLVQAGLETGARYGELAALQVQDFNADAGTITIRQSKAGSSRHVVLTDEGAAFFRQVCAGRAGHEIMLQKAAGGPWLKSHQKRPMAEASAVAKISPPVGFHGLRHTWASLAVMNGTPLMVVAKNLGHSDTRMVEKHYGHLAPSYIADAIRAGAPRFGFKPEKKIVALPTQRR